MDIQSLLATPRTPGRPRTLPSSSPETPTRPRRTYLNRPKETTRSDRIRIKTALEWGTPHKVFEKYRYTYGYTLRQIRETRKLPITPKKKTGRRPKIPTEKRQELKEWLLRDPSHRHIAFQHLNRLAPELGLQQYGEEAIQTAFRQIGYGRRVAKRKGFSELQHHKDQRLTFAREAISWSEERLFRTKFGRMEGPLHKAMLQCL